MVRFLAAAEKGGKRMSGAARIRTRVIPISVPFWLSFLLSVAKQKGYPKGMSYQAVPRPRWKKLNAKSFIIVME